MTTINTYIKSNIIKHINGQSLCQIHYDLSCFKDSLFEKYSITLPKSLIKSDIERKASYLAGRIACKYILEYHSIYYKNIDLLENKLPNWPSFVKGSISHTNKEAVATISVTEDLKGVGVDIESIFNMDTCATIYKKLLNPKEINLVKPSNSRYCVLMTLIFSAKESFFKGLYPIQKKYFGFHTICFQDINWKRGELIFYVDSPLNPEFNTQQKFTISFSVEKSTVITLFKF